MPLRRETSNVVKVDGELGTLLPDDPVEIDITAARATLGPSQN
jgi:hypothetical protein